MEGWEADLTSIWDKTVRRERGGGGLGVRAGGGLGGSGWEMKIYLVMRIESLMIMTNGINDTDTILVYLPTSKPIHVPMSTWVQIKVQLHLNLNGYLTFYKCKKFKVI